MKLNKVALAVGTVLLATGSAPAFSEGELSANIGVFSNYIWRGVTQTDGGPSVSGGVDFGLENGFYMGTWVSNVDWGTSKPNYEWDIYLGFGGEAGPITYDVNTIYYAYPDAEDGADADFWEIGGSVGFKFFTVGLQYTIDGDAPEGSGFRDGDIYYYGGVSFDLPQSFSIGATLGHYDFDDLADDEGDYTHWQIALTKDAGDFGEFTLAYDQTDMDTNEGDDDPQLWVSWSKTF